jgi:hypothetical protein
MDCMSVSVQCVSLTVMASVRHTLIQRLIPLYRSILDPPSSLLPSTGVVTTTGVWPSSASTTTYNGVVAPLEHSKYLSDVYNQTWSSSNIWQPHIIEELLPSLHTRIATLLPIVTKLRDHCMLTYEQCRTHGDGKNNNGHGNKNTLSASSLTPFTISNVRHQWTLAKQLYGILRCHGIPLTSSSNTSTSTSNGNNSSNSNSNQPLSTNVASPITDVLDLFLF